MSEVNASSTKRNIVIGSAVAVLALGGLGYYFFFSPSPDDIVKIKVSAEKIDLSKDFKEKLGGLGVTRIALVDKDGKLMALTADGDPINLCGSGSPECELVTKPKELTRFLSGASACGTCSDGSTQRFCHKDSGKWPCHNRLHHSCVSACQ